MTDCTLRGVIGRRKIVHQFPGRVDPKVVDDGGRPREFDLRCYVVGADYDIARDELRREFTTPGPGLLVHPYWGEFEVEVVSEVRIRETPSEGGMARFDLKLIEVGEEPLTIAVPDLGPQVEIKADAAVAAIKVEFTDSFSIVGAIASVVQTAVNAINQLASKMRQARGFVNAALGVIDDVGTAIQAVADAASALAAIPGDLADAVQGLIKDVVGAVDQIGDAFSDLGSSIGSLFGDFKGEKVLEAVRELTGDQGLDEVTDTGSGQTDIEKENQNQLDLLQRRTAAVEAARTLATLNYESRDFVLSVKDEVADILDALLLEANDDVWAALVDLRDVFSRRMLEIAEDLPNLTEFEPPQTIPALVIAYNVHGDSTRDAEIIARNNIKNPTKVPGGVELKVLVD